MQNFDTNPLILFLSFALPKSNLVKLLPDVLYFYQQKK